MGAILYVNGEIDLRDVPECHLENISSIKDGWGEQAFYTESGYATLMEEMEGCSPFEDGVMTPLKALAEYARENSLRVSGEFQVDSDWSDYDDLTVSIENGRIEVKNSSIVEADGKALREELYDRALHCGQYTKDLPAKVKGTVYVLYEAYKEDWKRQHLSIDRILEAYSEYFDAESECEEDQKYCHFDRFLDVQGYQGEMYVCFDEFCGAELMDKDYVRYLAAGNPSILACMEEYWQQMEVV